MKKRISFILLALCLYAISLSAAADTVQPFTLRNGITWGMTMEEFINTEKFDDPDEGALMDGMANVSIASNVRVSNFEATFSGVFLQNELHMCFYDLYNLTEDDTAYLVGALTEKYGEPINTTEFLFDAIHRLAPDMYPENTMTQGKCWHLPNGTTIQFACYGGADYMIAYMNYQPLIDMLDRLASEKYNLFGL